MTNKERYLNLLKLFACYNETKHAQIIILSYIHSTINIKDLKNYLENLLATLKEDFYNALNLIQLGENFLITFNEQDPIWSKLILDMKTFLEKEKELQNRSNNLILKELFTKIKEGKENEGLTR